jgi:hypothetical protein
LLPGLLLSAGCGDDLSTRTVTVHTGSSLLVAVDPEADGRWVRLQPQSDVEVEVGPRWLSASVGGGLQVGVVVTAHAPDEDDEVWLEDRVSQPDVVAVPTTVLGEDRAGVFVGEHGGVVEDGAGTIFAAPGTWDLYADDVAGPRALLQRDVEIADGVSLTLDFERDGFDLETRIVDVNGAIGAVSASSYLTLSGETSSLLPRSREAEASLYAVPSDRLLPEDEQVAWVSSSDGEGHATDCWVQLEDGPLEATMLAPLDGAAVSIDPIAGTWDTAEAWEGVSLHGFVGYTDEDQRTRVWSWNFYDPQAQGAGELVVPDLRAIPGWDPAWELPRDRDRSVSLRAVRDGCSTTWGQRFTTAQQPGTTLRSVVGAPGAAR